MRAFPGHTEVANLERRRRRGSSEISTGEAELGRTELEGKRRFIVAGRGVRPVKSRRGERRTPHLPKEQAPPPALTFAWTGSMSHRKKNWLTKR
jgi:hypothetical protein